MKYFNVKVNGALYHVEVEEASAAVQPQPQLQPQASPPPMPKAAPVSGNVKRVNSPMAGKIIDVKVKKGEAVKVNQTIIILEAMKMENEIVTPHEGVVAEVNVAVGQNVNTGDALISVS